MVSSALRVSGSLLAPPTAQSGDAMESERAMRLMMRRHPRISVRIGLYGDGDRVDDRDDRIGGCHDDHSDDRHDDEIFRFFDFFFVPPGYEVVDAGDDEAHD